MNHLNRQKNKLPVNFSLNLLNKKKKSVLVLASNKIEYNGNLQIVDKNFNFILKKCLKLFGNNSFIYLNNFEIIFVRGENIINFLWLNSKKS
jgi:small nuclear ribonucleoprotein (snRNP)-like protein